MKIGEILKKNRKDAKFETKEIKLEKLTFLDGILVTWSIFDKILDNRLRDEKGNEEKDEDGCSYLGIINDDITDLIEDCLLNHGYFKYLGEKLIDEFHIVK